MHTTFPAVYRLAFFKVTLLSLGPLLTGADMARTDRWEARSPVPGARAAHSAVWTGRELILWGGGIDGFFLNTADGVFQFVDPQPEGPRRFYRLKALSGGE